MAVPPALSGLRSDAVSLGRIAGSALFETPRPGTLAIAFASTVGWLLLTGLIRMVTNSDFYGVPLALAAVLVAASAGGLYAGLAATLLSVIVLSGTLPETRVVHVASESAWHLLVFSVVAILASGFQGAVRRLNARLRAEIEYKDSFLSLVAHELRTPATVICSGIRVLRLRGDDLSQQDRRDLIADIDSEAERFATMVEDLLLFAQIETTTQGRLLQLDLGAAVERRVRIHEEDRPDRPVELQIEHDALQVLGQERYVDVLLRHLLDNAETHGSADSTLVVSLSKADSHAVLTVRNLGPVVADSEARSVFQPYYRGSSVPEATRGLGLGLTLSRRIVEAMHGEIGARPMQGGGLEVWVRLPVR
jgi:signal transduction histidine kinase